MNAFLRVWARRLIPFALAGLGAALVAVNLIYVDLATARTSFAARWEGGRGVVRESVSPYDASVSQKAQERVYGRPANLRRGEDPQHFLYPYPSLALFAPLGLLDYRTARAIWMSLIDLALIGTVLVWIAALGWRPSPGMRACLVAFGALWFPAFFTLVDGQATAIVGLALAGALAAAAAQRDSLAGILLTAGWIKPQLGIGLLLFVAIWAWATGRRSLFGWLLLGSVVLVGGSFLAEPGWLLGMARQVFDYLGTPAAPSALARLSEFVGLGVVGTTALTAVTLGYLLWEWRHSLRDDRRRFLWTASLTQAVVLLVMPFSNVSNLVLLVLPIGAVLEAWYSRQGRSLDLAAATALVLVGGASWLLSLPVLEGGEASLWVLAGLPAASLVGLVWVRWWSIRGRAWSDLGSLGT